MQEAPTRARTTNTALGADPSLEQDGFLIVPKALSGVLLERVREAHERIEREEQDAGRLVSGEALHLLGFLPRD